MDQNGTRAAAPYTAFQSVKTVIKGSKEHGPPGRIDRSVLSNFSGAVGSQVLTALKFLDLIDVSGHPTNSYRALVRSYDTDDWQSELGSVIRAAYEPLFQLDLEVASPAQFNERFRITYAGTDDVLRKSVTFFLNAARDAGIKISPYLLKNKKPRTVGPRKARNPKAIDEGQNSRASRASDAPSSDTPSAKRLPVLIAALIDSLPNDGQKWTLDEASDWLQTAAYNFRYAYKMEGVMKVEITPVQTTK